MGYYMDFRDSTAKFKVSNSKKILQTIKGLKGKERITDSTGKHFSWVSGDFEQIDDIKKMFDEWRWQIERRGKFYYITQFLGEKLGDDNILFQEIARYMEDGFIEMHGEDGKIWRWAFEKGELNELEGKVIFEK